MKLRVGDTVKVISGKDKGKTGTIIKTYHKQNKVLVEGVNMIVKHLKPSQQNPEGGIVNQEAPILVNKVAYYDEKAGKTYKIGYTFVDGFKVRYIKNENKTVIDTKKGKK